MFKKGHTKFLELVRKISNKFRPKFSIHYVVYTILLAFVVFSVVGIVTATTPNPGHPWTEVGDGVFTFTSGQTATNYTYTFPAASTTVLTTNALVTVGQGGTGANTFATNGILIGAGASPVTTVINSTGSTLCLTQVSSGTPTWGACGGGSRLDQITAANTTATIDSLNNAIAWNWSTAATENPFAMSANALTTGRLLTLSSSATTTLTAAAANTGSLLDITESGAMTAFTGSLASINASGANAVGATGNALAINISGTAQLMKGIKFTDATTGALGTTAATSGGNLLSFTGDHTGYGTQFSDVTTTGTQIAMIANSLTTGHNLVISSTGTIVTTGDLLSLTANTATTSTGLIRASATGLTTGFLEADTLGTALTTGGAYNISGASYNHANGETGNLMAISFSDATITAGAVTSTTNGLNIASTIAATTSTSGVKTVNAINISSPTYSSCSGGATCTWNGLQITAPATTTNFTTTGLKIVADSLTTNGDSAMSISAAALTTGQALKITAGGATALTSGAGLLVTGPTGAAAISNGLAQITAVGNYTGTGGLLNVLATTSTAGTLANLTNNTASFTGTGINASFTGTTTGDDLLVSPGAGVTSGSAIKVTASGTSAISNGLVQITHSGNYTGTGGLLNVNNATSTAGTLVSFTNNTSAFTGTAQLISATGITTGFGLDLAPGAGVTSGSAIRVTASGTSAISNGLVFINHTGNYTTSSIGSLLTVQNASSTAGTLVNFTNNTASNTSTGLLAISSTGLTTGFNELKTMGTTLTTGGALNVTGAVYAHGAAETGNLANLSFASAATASGAALTNGLNIGATEQTSANTASLTPTTSGINVATTVNVTGGGSSSGTKTVNGINIASPTYTACSGGSNACVWNGALITAPATTTNFTTTGLKIVADSLTTNGDSAMSISAAALTTGQALKITAGGATALTSGAGLLVTGPTGAAAISNGLAQITAVGNYTGTGGLLNVLATTSTAGTLVNFTNNTASFTGNLQSISATGISTGTALSITGGSSLATNGELIDLQMGAATAGNGINIVNSGAYTGTGLINITANSLTTGQGINIPHTTSVIANGGSLVKLSSTSNDTSTTTGTLLDLSSTSSTAGTLALLTDTGLTTGVGLKIAHTTSVLGTGASMLRISSTTNDTNTTQGTLLDLSSSGSTAGTIALITNNTASYTGNTLSISSTGLTTGFNELKTMGTTLTTGGALNVTGAVYAHGAAETGNLANLSFASAATVTGSIFTNGLKISATEQTSANTASLTPITSGINVATTVNVTGGGSSTGLKTVNALNVASPTLTACSGGTNTCAWYGLNITAPTTAANINSTAINITASNFSKDNTAATGVVSAVAGMYEDLTFTDSAGKTQVGNRMVISNAPTTLANTSVGQIIRTTDNTSLANTVRGIEVVSSVGSNTAGTNTGIRATGNTFGIQGITNGTAGGVNAPAALYGESTGTTLGDVLRLYSTSITSAPSMATFYQDTSNFSGTALLMDIAVTGGTFSGDFANFKKAGVSEFKVTNAGDTSVHLAVSTNSFGLCHETNGAGVDQIKDCVGGPTADYAEMYPVENNVEYGDIVAIGTDMVNTYDTTPGGGAVDWNKVKGQITKLVKSNKTYQSNIIGIVSDNHNDFSSTGNNIKDIDNPMPVALNGRVPVKIASDSSLILPGDYITTSSEAGKGMKATKAGFVIGKALEAWTPDSGASTVMVYVEQGFYNGAGFSQFAGIDPMASDFAKQVLSQFMNSQSAYVAGTGSELVIDRLAVGVDIITPKVVADKVELNTISAGTGKDIGLALGPDGKFIINSTNNSSTTVNPVITFDTLGNATFAGTVTAKEIKVGDVTGIQAITDQINELSQGQEAFTLTASAMNTLSTALTLAQSDILKLQQDLANTETTVAGLTMSNTDMDARLKLVETFLTRDASGNLNSLATVSLSVVGDGTFAGKTQFDGLSFFSNTASFASGVTFGGQTEFALPPLFNKDSAGYALIKKGDKRAKIVFGQPYIATPVVNTSVTFEASDNIDDAKATALFSDNIRFIVVGKDQTGFTILLNKKAPRDIRFSWNALSVKDPSIFESVFEGLTIDPTPTLPTPEGDGTPTNNVGADPTPTLPTPEGEGTPTGNVGADPAPTLPTPEGDGTPTDNVGADPTPTDNSNTI